MPLGKWMRPAQKVRKLGNGRGEVDKRDRANVRLQPEAAESLTLLEMSVDSLNAQPGKAIIPSRVERHADAADQ